MNSIFVQEKISGHGTISRRAERIGAMRPHCLVIGLGGHSTSRLNARPKQEGLIWRFLWDLTYFIHHLIMAPFSV